MFKVQKNFMQFVISCFHFSRNHEIGHFVQMVMEAAYAVGCAQTKFISKVDGVDKHTVLTVCNYATIPILGGSIYTAGESASGCKTGKNPKYPGLCNEREKYNTN